MYNKSLDVNKNFFFLISIALLFRDIENNIEARNRSTNVRLGRFIVLWVPKNGHIFFVRKLLL